MSTTYGLLLALTSEDAIVPPPTGTTNYALLLALTSEAGIPAPPVVERRGGGTYLTQAELRKLRRQLDKQEAKERAEQQTIGQTIEQAYEDIAHPEIRIAREVAVRARQRQEQIDQEEQEFLLFLLDNYDTLH